MEKFTAASYLEAPLRSPAIPNAIGTHAIFQESRYSFKSHSKTVALKLLELSSGSLTVIVEDDTTTPPVWLSDEEFAWLSGRKTGNTNIYVASIGKPKDSYLAGTISGITWAPKTHPLSRDACAIAFAAKANKDGSLWNPVDQPKSLTTAKYYTKNYTRLWDIWTIEQRNTLCYSCLERDHDGKFILLQVFNALKVTGAELESPTPPFGGGDDFDIGKGGIVFVAKDPKIDESLSTKSDTYFLKIADYKAAAGKATKVSISGLDGHASCPQLSPSGRKIAFLKMKTDGREAEKSRVILVNDVDKLEGTEVLKSADGKGSWSLTPDGVHFRDEDTLLLIALEKARLAIYSLPTEPSDGTTPQKLTHKGCVAHVQAIGNGKLLFSADSILDSSYYGTLEPQKTSESDEHVSTITSCADHCKSFGLSTGQLSDIHWLGDQGREVHGFVMKPSDFSKDKKYPVCFLIHGGPQSAIMDSYNNYVMNPQIFAEQGYVVILPNVTGSRGYGQEFMDAINNNWGGSPYEDLVKCFEYVEKNMDFVDISRAVAGGISYGGYMTNWIQGHDLGRKFKALFTFNGIYSTHNMLATEELFFPREDLGGFPWDSPKVRATWDKWDPSLFTHNWSTPHFVLHTEKDFRLGMDNGLATFNTLQARGVESAFLKFEDEPHMVMSPENALVMYNAVLNFINKFVGLPAAADEIMPIR